MRAETCATATDCTAETCPAADWTLSCVNGQCTCVQGENWSIILYLNALALLGKFSYLLLSVYNTQYAHEKEDYKYLSCVPGVDGKIHPEGVVQHRR